MRRVRSTLLELQDLRQRIASRRQRCSLNEGPLLYPEGERRFSSLESPHE